MFARFDENPAMTLQDIKITKRYGRTDARTDGQRENSIPTKNKVCGGYNNKYNGKKLIALLNTYFRSKLTANLSYIARGHISSYSKILHYQILTLEVRSFSPLPLNHSRRIVVSYKRKYMHEVLVNCLLKLVQEKSVVW